jgi:hypothetical protein
MASLVPPSCCRSTGREDKRDRNLDNQSCERDRWVPPGTLAENRTKVIPKEVVESFLAHVDEVKYWSLPTREPADPNTAAVDGAEWVLEGVRNGTYKIVDRWSPENGPIRDLGLTMTIDLAGMKLLYQDVY